MTNLLAFSGSNREHSYNRQVLGGLVELARDAGAKVTEVNLGELQLPIYNADQEAATGLPDGAGRFREMLSGSDGFIVGCPEYNGFITPLLLNSIDWATRSEKAQVDVTPFANKVVLISSASPGMFGGMRSAGHLRTLLSGIGCIVLPQAMIVPGAAQALDEAGKLRDERLRARAGQVVTRLMEMTGRLA